MKTILVIGGAGYIGSHQVKILIERGFDVVVLDNLSTGHIEAIDPKATFVNGDIKDKDILYKIFTDYNIYAVMHFAAFSLVGESVTNPLKYFDNNVVGMQILLEAMTKCKIDKLIFSSTAAVYGTQDSANISEDSDTHPENPYGESKLIMEKMIKWVSDVSNIKYVALRYFNVAGASSDCSIGEAHNPETHLVPIVLEQPLNKRDFVSVFGDDYNTPDGTCIRDYIHVVDLVNAHVDALTYLDEGNDSEIFNVGYGHGYSVLEIIKASEKVANKEISYKIVQRRDGDPASLVADNSKLIKYTGWTPKYDDLNTILSSAFNWHKSHPNGYDI